MHLKGVLALLLAIVPDFDNSIYTGRGNLQTGVKPSGFHESRVVTLQRCKALARLNVPHFADFVSRCRYQKLLSRCKLYVPDTASMTFQCFYKLEGARLPKIDSLVLRAGGYQLVIRGHPHCVNVLLVCHYCHPS